MMLNPIRLHYDNQIFKKQKYGGISQYFLDLDLGMSKTKEVKTTNRNEADIIHATYYTKMPYRLNSDQRLVSTLYDMTPEKHPEFFLFGKFRSPHQRKNKWFNKSDLVISISQSSANDLIYYMPQVEDRLRVIHLSTNIKSVTQLCCKQLEGKKYILFVGKRGGYKNAMTIFRALRKLKDHSIAPLVVFAGGGEWSNDEKKSMTIAGIENMIRNISVNKNNLAWLYNHADAVIVPSLSEGFSLPLIEALMFNTPIFASDIEAHKEVSGDYATFVPALDTNSWSEIIMQTQAFASTKYRPTDLCKKENYQNLCNYYAINRMANEHISAYRSVL